MGPRRTNYICITNNQACKLINQRASQLDRLERMLFSLNKIIKLKKASSDMDSYIKIKLIEWFKQQHILQIGHSSRRQQAYIKIITLLAGVRDPFPCQILLKKCFADIKGEIKSDDVGFVTWRLELLTSTTQRECCIFPVEQFSTYF